MVRMTDLLAIRSHLHGGRGRFTLRSGRTGQEVELRCGTARKPSPGASKPIFLRLPTSGEWDRGAWQRALVGTIFAPADLAEGLSEQWTWRPKRDGADGQPVHRLPSVVAAYLVWAVNHGELHPQFEVWRHPRCCKCGRELTDPVSMDAGIGPECRKGGGR